MFDRLKIKFFQKGFINLLLFNIILIKTKHVELPISYLIIFLTD